MLQIVTILTFVIHSFKLSWKETYLQNISEKHSTVGLSAFGPFACFDALHVVS